MAPAKNIIKSGIGLLAVSLALALLLLVPFLATVPGLHGDEAWAGARAHEILQGKRPTTGMNWYTGPIQQYILAPVIAVFGPKVTSLRMLTVVNSLIFVSLYFLAARRLFNGFVAGLAVLLLVTLPAFTAYGRPAYEVFALNPVLAAGAIVLLMEANKRTGRARVVLWLVSGVCLGLGTWNHLIFIAVPLSLLASQIWRYRGSLFRKPALYGVYYGFLFAVLPGFLFALQAQTGNKTEVAGDFFPKLAQRLAEWPGLLLQMVHGYPIYQRFAGDVLFHSPDLFLPILAAGFLLRLRRGLSLGYREKELLVFGVVLFLSTLVLCPKNSDRYFLLVVYLAPLLMACAFNEMFEFAAAEKPHRKAGEPCLKSSRLRGPLLSPRNLAWGALLGFAGLQLTRTACNYFAAQIGTQGLITEYRFGGKPETSSNYIRTDKLYYRLAAMGARRVYAEFFIAMPLRFYDLSWKDIPSVTIIDSAQDVTRLDAPKEGDCAVTYAGGLRRVRAEDYKGFVEVFRDEHFIILKPETGEHLEK